MVTKEVVKRSFEDVGLWPMDYRFVQTAKEKHGQICRNQKQAKRAATSMVKDLERVMFKNGDPVSKVSQVLNIINGQSSTDQLDALLKSSIKPDLRGTLLGSKAALDRGEASVYRNHAQVKARRQVVEEEKNRKILEGERRIQEQKERKEAAEKERKKKIEIQLKKKEDALRKRREIAAEKEAVKEAKAQQKARAAEERAKKKKEKELLKLKRVIEKAKKGKH